VRGTRARGRSERDDEQVLYRQLAMLLNVVLRLVPIKLNAAIAATAISAAIRAYSIAVTPDWSLIRFEKNVRNSVFLLRGLKYTPKLQEIR